MFNNHNILITGATGSFGQEAVKIITQKYQPKKLIIFSRDELKQYEMQQTYSLQKYPFLRYFLGDIRSQERLIEAFNEVDYVIHAAALKQVPACEYNPFEAIKTNILGAQNIIQAAIKQNVKKVIALSTDKAANPINLYGATKLCSDKLFVAGNAMSGYGGPIFAVVRYGNVFQSRGSVIPFFQEKKKEGVLPITDEKMTRFSITLKQAVQFVFDRFEAMQGGEIYIPKIPSYRILDIAKAIAPDAKIKVIGIRPGEKLHETLLPMDDSRLSIEFSDHFVIQPDFGWWQHRENLLDNGGKTCAKDFSYTSENNTHWLSVDEIKKMISENYQ